MAIELASLGIKTFIERWIEYKKRIKESINEYLNAAAKDHYIEHIDVVMLKGKILELIKTTESLNKSEKKKDSDLEPLIENAKHYIILLKEISNILPYEHLNNILRLQGKVKEISFGEFEVLSDHEEIALVCIYLADIVLTWLYDVFLDPEHIEVNYEVSTKGIEFLLTAQKLLSRKRNINESLKNFVNTYLVMYKSTSQYFLSRKKLKQMVGIKDELTNIANGFNYVIRRLETIINDSEKHNLNDQYLLSANIIYEHSIALLCEINAVKFNVRGLKSFKKLDELSKISKEKTNWKYTEWEPLCEQLKYDWGLKSFEESDIDYDVGGSVNLFYDSNSRFDDEIERIDSFDF